MRQLTVPKGRFGSIASFERCRACLLHPDSGRVIATQRTDALGQKETHAPQQKDAYSITSSAMASSTAGTSRPSALAVFRLMTNSNLVGRTTGKSLALSPLRMRPA